MEPKELTWKTDDGLEIYCRDYSNPEARKEIWIVHGMGDHGGRYQEFATQLVEAGYRVIIADHRGNGRSEGKRGHVPKFATYLNDLEQTIDRTKSDREGFILGQSMGSLIVARYLQTVSQEFAKAVMFSPMFRTTNPPPRMKLLLAKCVRAVYPSLTLRAGLKSADLTSSEDRKAEYRRDELKHDLVSAELGLAMFEQGELAIAESDQISIPTLVMHGEIDQITSPEASREFAAGNDRIDWKKWPGKRHELHNETDNQEMLEFVLNWLG